MMKKMVPKNLRKAAKAKANRNKEKNAAATVVNTDKIEEDKSVLTPSIEVGVKGVKELVKAYHGGTDELQDLLINECNIIYECKLCRNLFRSVANFISHKRAYCVKKFYSTDMLNKIESDILESQLLRQNDVVVIPDMPPQDEQNLDDPDCWVTSDKTGDGESVTLEGLGTLSPRKKMDSLRLKRKQDITEAMASVKRKRAREAEKTPSDVPDSVYYSNMARRMMEATPSSSTFVELESVKDTSKGVYQTVKRSDCAPVDSMKVQLIDLDRIISKNQAILQANGKFTVTSQKKETEEEKNMKKHCCPFCDSSFLTEQTLVGHIQIYHRERVCYPCPLCRIFFASPSGVYRHLSKAHHRIEQQIRRLRPQVLSKARKRLLQSMKDDCESEDERKRSEREADDWKNNFEGALRCNGCGKLFNRRAALNVHSMTCRKMEALLNAAAARASKAKSSKTTKSAAKSSKSTASMLQKSGILIRKDYGKSGSSQEKLLSSSLLAEVEKGSSSSEPYDRVVSGPSNANYNFYDKMSTSSDNSSVSGCSSQKSSAKSNRNSSRGAASKKGKQRKSKKSY